MTKPLHSHKRDHDVAKDERPTWLPPRMSQRVEDDPGILLESGEFTVMPASKHRYPSRRGAFTVLNRFTER